MVAEIYISLKKQFELSGGELKFLTKSELRVYSGLIDPLPDAFFVIREGLRKKPKRYFLDVFGEVPPRIMRSRVNKYIEYFDSDEWQDNVKWPFPKVVLVCTNNRLRTHVSRYIKTKSEQSYYTIAIKFIVVSEDYLKANGLNLDNLPEIPVTEDD